MKHFRRNFIRFDRNCNWFTIVIPVIRNAMLTISNGMTCMKADDSSNKAKTTPVVFLRGLNHPLEKSCLKKKDAWKYIDYYY